MNEQERKAMEQALEALEKLSKGGDPRWADDVIPALRQLLEQHPAVSDVVRDVFASHDAFSRAIEAKLKEKNT